ncbi:MAG: uroporphyrinogen decarboxylase family protein [Candidatus Eremiobacterota bacterium]
MNSLERVTCAIKGETSDRPAVSITLSLYGARLTDCPLEKYYTDYNAYVEGQSAVIEHFHPDIVFSPFVLTAEGEAFGSRVKFFKNQPPNMSEPSVKSAEEFLKLPMADINSSKRLLYIREATGKLAGKYGREIPLAGILLGPADLPALVMGIDAWLYTLMLDRDSTRKILEKTGQFFINLANALLCDGANFVVIPAVFSNPSVVTKKIIEELVMPVYREVFKEIRGPVVLHHGGKTITPVIDYYTGLPNVAAFVIDNRDSFSEARIKTGSEKLLLGNIDGATLNKREPEEIKDKCLKILKDRRNDRHFILSTSGPDVPYDTPVENIQAIISSVSESIVKGEE